MWVISADKRGFGFEGGVDRLYILVVYNMDPIYTSVRYLMAGIRRRSKRVNGGFSLGLLVGAS